VYVTAWYAGHTKQSLTQNNVPCCYWGINSSVTLDVPCCYWRINTNIVPNIFHILQNLFIQRNGVNEGRDGSVGTATELYNGVNEGPDGSVGIATELYNGVNEGRDSSVGIATELYNGVNEGRDSSVGIATRYGLDGPGIELRWGCEIFRTRPDRPCGPSSLLYNGYRVFTGGKAAGAWRSPPNPI
jgi:hypothetical protein